MYVSSLGVQGFAALPSWQGELGRVARLGGPARSRAAVSDALLLLAASFDRAALAALLHGWGAEAHEILGGPLPEGATFTGPRSLRSVVAPGAEGMLRVTGTLRLDPPLFGKLRQFAVRDVRLVDALGSEPTVTLKVGARFSPEFDAVGVDLLAFAVGRESFAVAGKERPDWLDRFFRALSGRIGRGPLAQAGWIARAGRWDPESQHAVRRGLRELSRMLPGQGLELVMMPEGIAGLGAAELVPLRRLGAGAERAAGLVGAVWLSGAEVLVIDEPPVGRRWRAWLAAAAETSGSPLEQLVIFDDDGAPLG